MRTEKTGMCDLKIRKPKLGIEYTLGKQSNLSNMFQDIKHVFKRMTTPYRVFCEFFSKSGLI